MKRLKNLNNSNTYNEDTDRDYFFSVSNQICVTSIDKNKIDYCIFYNEIEMLVKKVATGKVI